MILLWQIYLTIYLLFFRLNKDASPARFNADQHKAVIGTSLVFLFLLFALWSGTALTVGRPFDFGKFAVAITTVGLFAGNYQLLVRKKAGIEFERHFNHLPRPQRIWLRVAAIAISAGSFAVMFMLVMMYRSKFYAAAH